MQALIKSTNKGLGLSTVLLYSVELSAEIHFLLLSSTISTNWVSGLMPAHFMPAVSNLS